MYAMTVESPYLESNSPRRNSSTTPVVAVLTYTKQRRSLIGENYAGRRRHHEDWQVLCKACVFGVVLMAFGLYISHERIVSGRHAAAVGARVATNIHGLLLLSRRNRRPTTTTASGIGNGASRTTTVLEYRRPHKHYERNIWTMTEFVVNGVNLASFGFETTTSTPTTDNSTSKQFLTENFLLYEDFDISSDLQEHAIAELEGRLVTPCASDLLLYHRHLDHASLAFYMDQIAQRHYHRAIGVPTPTPFLLRYKDDWKHDNNKYKNDEDTIRTFLPQEATDYVVKASHRITSPLTLLVSYDKQTRRHVMGHRSDNITEAYDADHVAQQLAQAMHQEIQYNDPWALLHVHPGIVVEERITAFFDSTLQSPLEIQVYVIWGKVWMASWPRAEDRPSSHPGMIHRNGTAIMDDHTMVKVPDWIQWEIIVALAEHLSAHKDIFQVNVLVGIPADQVFLLQHATRQEQLAAIQVMVINSKPHPSLSFHEKELLDEMGRLWLAGYYIGIHEAVPNREVPEEYVHYQHLTEINTRDEHILAGWADAGFVWKDGRNNSVE
jgi:hypothetical protein